MRSKTRKWTNRHPMLAMDQFSKRLIVKGNKKLPPTTVDEPCATVAEMRPQVRSEASLPS
jgi:hypothetical protein